MVRSKKQRKGATKRTAAQSGTMMLFLSVLHWYLNQIAHIEVPDHIVLAEAGVLVAILSWFQNYHEQRAGKDLF